MTTAAHKTPSRPSTAYQFGLAILLGLAFGTVLFDRNAVNFLSPYLAEHLHLTNSQIGLAAGVLSLGWATGGLIAGRLSDRTGRRKPLLLVAILLFSVCSIATGLTSGFAALLAVRLLMGLAEGPVPPLANALLMDASRPQRRGLNVGIYAFCAALLGAVLAPLILVGWAETFGWRSAFFFAGAPGLVLAVILAVYLREAKPQMRDKPREAPARGALSHLLRIPNIWLCAIIASLVMTCFKVSLIFLPLYLTQAKGFSPLDMGLAMSLLGGANLVAGLMLPALSDRFGRKPVIVAMCLLGALPTLACVYGNADAASLAGILALWGAVGALLHIVVGVMPGESAPLANRATALALVMGFAEIVGGFASPTLTGLGADAVDLVAAPIIAGVSAVGAGFLALFLTETAPRRVAAPAEFANLETTI